MFRFAGNHALELLGNRLQTQKPKEHSSLDLPRLTQPAHTGQSPEAPANTIWFTLIHEAERIINGDFGISFEIARIVPDTELTGGLRAEYYNSSHLPSVYDPACLGARNPGHFYFTPQIPRLVPRFLAHCS